MTRFVVGYGRSQSTLFPDRLRHEADASEAAEEQHRPFSSLS
jgi:hypothetical protein